jgi:hypothetical protein
MRRGVAALGSGILLATAFTASSARANEIVHSDTQWLSGSRGNGYYAGMVLDTKARFGSGRTVAYQDYGYTSGGAYYSGPYGDSGVKAKSLTQYWTITLQGTTGQSCSVGFPSGFTCTVSGIDVTGKDSNSFGASYPTSSSLPQDSYTAYNHGVWSFIKFASSWKVYYTVSGTTIERTPGTYNTHS